MSFSRTLERIAAPTVRFLLRDRVHCRLNNREEFERLGAIEPKGELGSRGAMQVQDIGGLVRNLDA